MGRVGRRHPRFPVSLTGTLELLEDGGRGTAFGIQVTDVSGGGLGIITGGPLPVGAKVRLQMNGGTLLGSVVHCRLENGHFAAGISVEHDSGVLCSVQWIASLRPSAHGGAGRASLLA